MTEYSSEKGFDWKKCADLLKDVLNDRRKLGVRSYVGENLKDYFYPKPPTEEQKNVIIPKFDGQKLHKKHVCTQTEDEQNKIVTFGTSGT